MADRNDGHSLTDKNRPGVELFVDSVDGERSAAALCLQIFFLFAEKYSSHLAPNCRSCLDPFDSQETNTSTLRQRDAAAKTLGEREKTSIALSTERSGKSFSVSWISAMLTFKWPN